jgi:hypothetical protein
MHMHAFLIRQMIPGSWIVITLWKHPAGVVKAHQDLQSYGRLGAKQLTRIATVELHNSQLSPWILSAGMACWSVV